MSSVFISYRRSDSEPWATLLYEKLSHAFGGKHIFFDIEHLSIGEWKGQIEGNLNSSSIMIVVIGKDWVSKRLHDKNDIHRYEIKTALDRNIVIIPIITPGAEIPEKETLPKDISSLFDYEVIKLSQKNEQREIQVKKVQQAINEITKLRIINKYPQYFYKLGYGTSVLFLLFIISMIPEWKKNYDISKFRERWEKNYQKSYEELDTKIFKSTHKILPDVFSKNKKIDKGILIFSVIDNKINGDKNAQTLIPQYVDFFESWLSFCDENSCSNEFFNRKALEFWANYKCWINKLRLNGYPVNYGYNIENHYERNELVLKSRSIANKERKKKVNNSFDLCQGSSLNINF